mgnify:CR=1 FL=1
MKKKIINVFLMALLAMVTVGTVVSCKDYEEDNYSDLNGKFTNLSGQLQDQIDALEKFKGELETELTELKNGYQEGDKVLGDRITIIEDVLIPGLDKKIDELERKHDEDIDDLWLAITGENGINEAIADLSKTVSGNTKAIEDLQKLIDKDKADEWSKAVEDAAEALERAKNDSAKLALLGDNLEDYDKMRDALAGALRDANGNWMSLEEYIKAQGFLTSDDIKDFVTKAEFNDSLNVFRARIDEVSSKLEALTTEINTKLGLLQNSLNKYVSSVLIQGTDNPVFGSFAFPANISSNVLAAYYGDVKDLKFPTDEPYNYVDAQNALSAKDLEMMGVAAGNQYYNGRVVSGMQADGTVAAGNAGTLYVTVNPNTVDATRATAVLVNSQDSKSGVMLSPLAETDKVLNFGYTRATGNGFYEAKATVTPSVVDEVSPRISYDDLKGLKNEIKDAVNAVRNKGNVDITGLVYSVYSISSNILDAQAVKFPWSDTDIYGNTIERATYSQYSLAATAVHPLSFAFAKDVHYDEFPGINKVEDIIGDMFNKIEDAIPTIDVDNLNIHIEIEDFVFDPVELEDGSVEVNVDILDEETGKHYKQTIDITDKVEEAVNEALGSAAGDVSAYIKDVVDQLNEQVAQINDIIDQLRDINEIGNKLDEVEDKIYDYLSKGENLLLKLVNNANELLQPMMLAKTADSYVVLSRSASAPTKFRAASMTTDGIILRPTTYSAEVLAPAFKKFVGVANVYKDGKSAQGGDANCQAALKAANSSSEGFCTVQEGDWNKARFKVSSQYKKGYVYEIVYTAADYSGKIVVKRFYIELV